MENRNSDAKKLVTFFERHNQHKKLFLKSKLNDAYFWKVLSPYPGLVKSGMYLRVLQGREVEVPGEGMGREFSISNVVFDLDALMATNGNGKRYRLIKLYIDFSDDPQAEVTNRHSNLIYIDTEKKEIVRFEPIVDAYTRPINTVLEDYFQALMPEYKFKMLDEHPLSESSGGSKTMDDAYVLKKAMLLVAGIPHSMKANKSCKLKILKFASAIESEYGEINNRDGEYGLFQPGTWKPETRGGVAGAAIGAGAGLLLTGGFTGMLIGAGAGGLGGFLLSKKSDPQPPRRYY